MNNVWRIQLFGTLHAQQGEYSVQRFSTQKTGLLLAYLAYFSHRNHSRETLIEMLWPDVDVTTGRNRFKQALASLRRHFQTAKPAMENLIHADRYQVGISTQRLLTDVSEFQAALRQSGETTGEAKKALLERAVALYQGDLLADFYEDWILPERQRLSESCLSALRQLTTLCRETQEWEQALHYTERALALDPWQETDYAVLMQLHREMGRPAEALRQFETWQRLLWEEWKATPSEELCLLAQQLRPAVSGSASMSAAKETARSAHLPTPSPPSSSSPLNVPSPRLPISLTRFFGRDEEMRVLESLLLPSSQPDSDYAHRLVTLLGPGGTGKTRLAQEVARRIEQAFAGRVWFLPLADITQACLVPNALAEALPLRRSPTLDPLEQSVDFFRRAETHESTNKSGESPPSLLVLDNFEHLVEEGAMLVATLLREVPTLVCLVTSRHALNLEGEREIVLQPLPLPPLSDTPDRLWEAPSVQLFVDRARARRADFALTPHNAASIAALCHRLEGVPLALELAAGWARTLTPAQMLERLQSRFDLLTSHRKDVHPRHASLLAAMEWSFRLLPAELQEFLLQLSVFRGGWTLEAAETVCTHPRTLHALNQLCEYSLAFAQEQNNRIRYYLLETIRQYAEDKLYASGKADVISQRHQDYFLALVEKRQDAEIVWEYDNLRTALDHCLDYVEDWATRLRFLREMSWFWGGRGFWEEGRRYSERILSENLIPEQRVQALYFAVILTIRQGDYTAAHTLCEEGVAIWQTSGNERETTRWLGILAIVCYMQGDYVRAIALYERCLEFYQGIEDGELPIAGTLHNMGCAAQAWGDLEAAREYQQQSLAVYRRLNHSGGIALCLGFLGDLVCIQGDYVQARQLLEESISLFRQFPEKPRVAEMLVRLAAVVERQGELATADQLLAECLPMLQEVGDKPNVACALQVRVRVAIAERDYVRAARLLGSAQGLREEMQIPVPKGERQQQDIDRSRLIDALGKELFLSLVEAGRKFSWTQAIAYALSE